MMNTTLARTTNNSLENLRPQEVLEQQANEFYIRALSRWMQQTDSIQNLTYPFQYLDTTETDSLRSIAQTQVRIGGRAVYLAESILFEYYHPIDAEVSARKEMEEEKIIDVYTIYPNPTSGICFLHKNIKSNLILHVFDITGREISSKKITSEMEVIDLNELAAATYIFKLTDENEMLVGVEKINLIK